MLRTAQWIAQVTGGQLVGDPTVVAKQVITDSREATPGCVYVARVGENSDGHDYIPSAVAQGAVIILGERHVPSVDVVQVIVKDATLALGAMARAHVAEYRASGQVQVVAVTGSAGKTTTKDLLGQILSSVAPTVYPRLSFNNEVGLPLTVLDMDEATRYLVLEMGASGPGHLRYLTDIVAPDVAIELMVGHAHLGGFGSVEGIARAKRELIEGLRPGGTAILNADDDYVRSMSEAARGPVRFFSAAGGNASVTCDYWAEGIELSDDERPSFTLVRRTPQGEERAHVDLQLVGAHHVSNALAAASACCELGLSLSDVAAALSGATAQSPHRMALSQIVVNGHPVTLIDDSYNANSDSMRAALSTLASLKGERHAIAVLGEMLELGQASAETHRQVGTWASEAGVDDIVALGAEAIAYCQGAAPGTGTTHVASCPDAVEVTRKLIHGPSIVLVKGSNGSGAWRVADALNERGQSS